MFELYSSLPSLRWDHQCIEYRTPENASRTIIPYHLLCSHTGCEFILAEIQLLASLTAPMSLFPMMSMVDRRPVRQSSGFFRLSLYGMCWFVPELQFDMVSTVVHLGVRVLL